MKFSYVTSLMSIIYLANYTLLYNTEICTKFY